LDEWAEKDPLENFIEFLRSNNILSEEDEVKYNKEIVHEINKNLALVNREPMIEPDSTTELNDVFENFEYKQVRPNDVTEELRLIDAISQGLKQSMERHDDLIIMGQDIAEYGGVFKITEGFVEAFGRDRIRNTPICESAIVSAAMGLSISGIKSVMEMQFSDFVTSGFNPIINHLAKSHYRWNQKADVVIRMPCGAGVSAGPYHSQTNEAWFTHTPGLKVVFPAFPYDAKGLLATSIEDPNPVLFFEHKALYRTIRQEVPTDYYTIPLGKAALLKEGDAVTIVTYGAGVHWALDTLNDVSDISADLIDLRTLAPLDTEAIYTSVKKTGRVIILQEDSMFGGIASDISALISENCFEYLDAPIKRVASMETPIPFATQLEAQYLPKNKFKQALQDLMAY
ncbi:MAG: 2-oxoisovalerate dehydrogenase E1 component, partial [Ulvibacter sp.]